MKNWKWDRPLIFLMVMMFTALVVPPIGYAQGGPDAAHIKELVPHGYEDPIAFLKRIPFSFEAILFYFLVVSELAGMVASWLWKWTQGLADGFHHFTVRYVVGQVLWVAGSAGTLITTLGFVTDGGEFWGWLSVITYGALAGWSGEVKVKKDA